MLEDGMIVGRIFKVPIAPEDRPWMWASGHNRQVRLAARGYEATREAAMAAFAKSWRPGAGPVLTSAKALEPISKLPRAVDPL